MARSALSSTIRPVTTVKAAIDAGLTFLDTAESYFDSQAKIGEAIKGRRDEVFLATKVSGSDHSAEHIASALADSLRLLGTDYIDLYQLHSPQPQWSIEDTIGELVKHRDAGEDTLHRRLQFLCRPDARSGAARPDTEFAAAVQHLVPGTRRRRYCRPGRELGIGTIVYSVMAKGLLASKYKPGHQFPRRRRASQLAPLPGRAVSSASTA